MDVNQLLQQTRDSLTVGRVFGEPLHVDGITIIPVASVGGGGGGGHGEGQGPQGAGPQSGSGGGFALTAKPAGAYVVEGGRVRWRPAVDANRVVLGAQLVAIVALLVLRSIRRGH